MCVIIIADKKNPPKSLLKKAEKHNSDGAGIAWIDQKKKCVRWIKGKKLSAKKIKQIIKEKRINVPYIIHFRIGTVGSVCDQLSHPFPLSEGNKNLSEGSDYEGVLFHNGHYDKWSADLKMVYSSYRENIPNEKMSDSRAISLLASKNKMGLGYLQTFTSQKIAVLTPNGIKRFGSDWCKVEKFTCSNDHFDWSYTSCENDNINNKTWSEYEGDDLGTSDQDYQKYLDDDTDQMYADDEDDFESYNPRIKKRDRSVSYCKSAISKDIKDQDDLCRSLDSKKKKKKKHKKSKVNRISDERNKELKQYKDERVKEIIFKMDNSQYETVSDFEYELKILKAFTKDFQDYKELKMPNFDKIYEKIDKEKYFNSNRIKATIIENAKIIDNTVDQEKLTQEMEEKKQSAMYELDEIMPITRGVKYD